MKIKLTPVLQIIFDLICQGYSQKEIALIRGKKLSTIRNQEEELRKRLGVKNRAMIMLKFGKKSNENE